LFASAGYYNTNKYYDKDKAKVAYGKACDGGDAKGCEEYAQH